MSAWKTTTLGEVSVDGGHYGIAASAVDYSEDLPTYLRITDIRDDGTVIHEGLMSVDHPDARDYLLCPNDLVIARTGASTGRNYFYDGRDGDFVYAGFLIKFSISPSKIHPPFVKHWFQSPAYRSWLNSHTDGSTRANINAVTLSECPIRYPDIPTQKKIAAILSSLDDKIENNRKICKNLEEQAQAIFKSWFVDFEPFGGEMPKGWKLGRLEELAEITMGQSPDGSTLFEAAMVGPARRAGRDMAGGSRGARTLPDAPVTFFQGRAEFGPMFPTRRLLTTAPNRMARQFDILLSVRAPVGDLNIALEECCIGRGLAALHSRWGSQAYLWCLLKSLRPAFDLYEGAGTIFGSINKDSLRELEVVVPDVRRVSAFENAVGESFAMMKERELESRALAELRDALLPKLMSGEIDVGGVAV